MPENTSN